MSADKHQDIDQLHQIFITDAPLHGAFISSVIDANTLSLRTLYPSANYTLWTRDTITELLRTHFEPELLWAFDLLTPYAFKADLARLCILFIYGGLSVDLGMRSINILKPPHGVGLASFRDYDLLSPSWTSVATGIIWAHPGRREFRIAINYILANCRNKYYGTNPLYPTGPVLFGRAVAAAMVEKGQEPDADDQWIGVSRPLTPGKPVENIAYIAPDQTLIAIRNKSHGGDLADIGASGTNNYNHLWRRRAVYGEHAWLWMFDDPAIRLTDRAVRTSTGITTRSDENGLLTFGPYIDLEAGNYRLSLSFAGATLLPRMKIDVAFDAGRHVLTVHERGPMARASQVEIAIEFEAPQRLSDVEFRTELFGEMIGQLVRFGLEKIDD
jgi:hypothetical protein